MNEKPFNFRERVERDIDEAVDYYYAEAGEAITLKFADDVQDACHQIARHPATGSPRWAGLLKITGLRSRALKRFPYLVFYIEQPDHIDVFRILHRQRDIPASMEAD